jgi:alkanesulfonate monooxygenase SsuD/methylene tetrahydromethanopterin reductase-like flavin-dependent oxidoreductase (luciferase family)
VSAKRGLFLPPFDELVEAATLVDLARRAEASGWDGFFLWDHVNYTRQGVGAVADAWIALAAIAGATERIPDRADGDAPLAASGAESRARDRHPGPS